MKEWFQELRDRVTLKPDHSSERHLSAEHARVGQELPADMLLDDDDLEDTDES